MVLGGCIGDNGGYGDFVNRMGDLMKNGEKEMDTAMSIFTGDGDGDVLPHFCFFVYRATDPTSECLNLFRFAARGRDILNFVASGRPIPARVT